MDGMTTPYDIYPVILKVLSEFEGGQTLTRSCRNAGITVRVFKKWVADSQELTDLYEEADTLGYDAMAEALVNIDNHEIHGTSDAKMAAVISKNIQWLLERRKPREYGNKVSVEVNIAADRAITDALNRGKQRALAGSAVPLIAAEVVDAIFEEVSDEAEFLASIGA